MVDPVGVSWNQLSRGVTDALAWGRAAEVDAREVGTRGLLIGMLRSGEDPPNALLHHFGVTEAELFAALQRQVPDKRLDPVAARRPDLDRVPDLTTNAQRCLERAAGLQREAAYSNLDVACLLAALLDVHAATARAAIAQVIVDVEIEAISVATLAWLRKGGSTYPEALQERFPMRRRRAPDATGPATKRAPSRRDPAPSASTAGDTTDADDPPGTGDDAGDHGSPWPPFVMALSTGFDTGDSEEQRIFGVGVLVSATRLAIRGSASRAHSRTGDVQEIVPVPSGEHFGLCSVTPPAAGDDITIVPQSAPPQPGLACWIVSVAVASADEPVDLRVETGRVAAPAALDDELYVELDGTLAGDRSAFGSPVIAGGKLVGIVDRDGSAVARFRDGDRTAGVVIALTTVELDRLTIGTGTLVGAGNDAVGEVDQLGFRHYVNAFATLIASPDTKPPLTIGIFGSWGMGKSFLLQNIAREIVARQEDGAVIVHVVHFNAWEYSATDVVWPGLVRKVVSALDKDVDWPWYKTRWTRLKRNLPRKLRRLDTQIASALLVIVVAVVAAWLTGREGLAATIGGVAAVFGVGGVLKAAQDPVARWITALFADSDYGRQLGVMEDIKDDLEALEVRLHKKGDPAAPVTGRVLILIDDLDRCEPAKAVEVLQAVNLLLNFSGFIVCLGIDARIINGVIEKHYEGLLGPAGASGYEYLDKIVQIPFRIPEPAPRDVIRLLGSELGNPLRPGQVREDDGADRNGDDGRGAAAGTATAATPVRSRPSATEPTTGSTARLSEPTGGSLAPTRPTPPPAAEPVPEVAFTYHEREAFELFAMYLRPNPRHVKRLVNVYRLVRELASSQGERLILDRPAATIRWLVMWAQWPYASLKMIDRFEELRAKHPGGIPLNVSDGEPLEQLLAHVEPQLDEQRRRQLDDDPGVLRKLLSIKGYALSWEEIQSIRRYTVNFNPAVEEQVRAERLPAAPGAADVSATGIGTA